VIDVTGSAPGDTLVDGLPEMAGMHEARALQSQSLFEKAQGIGEEQDHPDAELMSTEPEETWAGSSFNQIRKKENEQTYAFQN
jgi:hypothetical protein